MALASCILFALAGCGAPQPAVSDFDFVFKYGYGAVPVNELDTFNGTYTKDMILEPSITVNLTLTPEEKTQIRQKMEEIDFFSYPDRYEVIVPPGSPGSMVTPYPSYYFMVKDGTIIKELLWGDSIRNADAQATELRRLIAFIQNIIESKEEYKRLPPTKGGYM